MIYRHLAFGLTKVDTMREIPQFHPKLYENCAFLQTLRSGCHKLSQTSKISQRALQQQLTIFFVHHCCKTLHLKLLLALTLSRMLNKKFQNICFRFSLCHQRDNFMASVYFHQQPQYTKIASSKCSIKRHLLHLKAFCKKALFSCTGKHIQLSFQ